jgi:uncharacterized protein involved in type VI secretion and phage assembly
MTERLAGKHMALIVDVDDPKHLSRVRVKVPEVFGDEETGWCLPSSPYAGKGVGLSAVPPVGSVVFVEWPAGDTTRAPIWSGGLWADGQAITGQAPDRVLLVTPGGNALSLIDESGKEAIELVAKSKAKVRLDKDGVRLEFSGCKVELRKGEVVINGGALRVKKSGG